MSAEQEPKPKIDLDPLFAKVRELKPEGTVWFGITGSWRKGSEEVEAEVRRTVREIMEKGGGIVSGGALGVDYQATDEALMADPGAERIRVFLPAVLELYAAHYRRRASEGVITSDQAESLIAQLTRLKEANPAGLIEHPTNTEMNPTTYFERNTEVVRASDAVLGFHVNESAGVGDALQKATDLGKPVASLKFVIE